MAEVTDEHKFEGVKWTIVNFSFWSKDLHGPVIESQDLEFILGVSLKLELRPKGGVGECLLASIICKEPVALLGTFSIIGPDGSILSSCEMKGTLSSFSLPGPNFEEVVAQIRKNETRHEDRITLKLSLRWKYKEEKLARTEISTINTSWNISSPTLKSLTSDFNWISRILYQLDDDTMGEMDLVALRVDSEIKLQLNHEQSLKEKVLVLVILSVLGKDRAVLATVQKEHVFCERESWMFWNSALTKEIEEDFSLILQVKIVPSVKYKYQRGHYTPIFRHCLL